MTPNDFSTLVSAGTLLTSAVQSWYTKRQFELMRMTGKQGSPVESSRAAEVTSTRQQWSELLREVFREELPALLESVDPFSQGGESDVRRQLLSFEPFASRLKDPKALRTVGEAAGVSEMLGVEVASGQLRAAFGEDQPLTVMFPPIQLGATAIFYYLKHEAK